MDEDTHDDLTAEDLADIKASPKFSAFCSLLPSLDLMTLARAWSVAYWAGEEDGVRAGLSDY